APKRRDRNVVEEVSVRYASALERGKDRGVWESGLIFGLRWQLVVGVAVGRRCVHVFAVGQRRSHQRAVEVIERHERLGRGLDETEIALPVIGDRELVVARLQKAVAATAVQLPASTVPRVVWIWMPAALPVRRQWSSRQRVPRKIHVAQPSLTAVGIRHPAEVMIE